MKTNGGFTLIELLIVLTIIGILVALSINGFWYVAERQNRNRAKIEIKALKTALIDYRSKYDGYPTCPNKICTPGECLFLSLAGFHNERGMLEIPPYAPLVPPTFSDTILLLMASGEIPDFTHNDGKSLILWLSKTLEKERFLYRSMGERVRLRVPEGGWRTRLPAFFNGSRRGNGGGV